MVLVKKLTCGWGWIKTPAVSLNRRNDNNTNYDNKYYDNINNIYYYNNTASGGSVFSCNHQTKSYTEVDLKPQEEPNAIWKDWEYQQAALGSSCFPLALWYSTVGCDLVIPSLCGFPTFKEASFQKRVMYLNPFLLSHGSSSILQAK